MKAPYFPLLPIDFHKTLGFINRHRRALTVQEPLLLEVAETCYRQRPQFHTGLYLFDFFWEYPTLDWFIICKSSLSSHIIFLSFTHDFSPSTRQDDYAKIAVAHSQPRPFRSGFVYFQQSHLHVFKFLSHAYFWEVLCVILIIVRGFL